MSLNRYAYVQSNPINFVDPSGLIYDVPFNSCTAGQNDDPCITVSSRTGSDTVRRSKVNTSLLAEWGVVLTVKCNIKDENRIDWNTPPSQIQNLVGAIRAVNDRLLATTGFGFFAVMGGLEIRHTGDTEVGNGAAARTPVQQSGFLMIWGDIGRTYKLNVLGTAGENNIIHELGHVLNYRTGSASIGNSTYVVSMQNIGNNFILKNPKAQNGTLSEAQTNDIGEAVPDHFLNWVRLSYNQDINSKLTTGKYSLEIPSVNDKRIATYWVGGEFESENGTVYSPGMIVWASLAIVSASRGLISFNLPK